MPWNSGKLMRIELDQNGSVLSMNKDYNQSGGIIAVEMAPNEKLYFSSADAIYTCDLTTSIPPPMNVAMITLEVLDIIAAIGALVIAALYYAPNLRSSRSSTLPSRSLRHAFLDESGLARLNIQT